MLAGTLNDVSLPEVLSLLSHATKTGSVHLVGEGVRGRIDLIGGSIGMAQAKVGKLALVRRLVAEGQLDATQLVPGLPAAAASPDPDIQLVRSAYRAGALTAEQVRQVVEEHLVDAMFDLGRVESGRFRFDPCRVADLGVQRAPEDVFDDVATRTEEWEAIRDTIPAPGAIVRMLPAISQDEVVVSPSTWRLLALVDGRRTVAQLGELLGRGEFPLSRSLHRLVEAGLVEVAVSLGDAGDEAEPDTVLPLERQLATLRSDPTGDLDGHFVWEQGDAVPASRPGPDPTAPQGATRGLVDGEPVDSDVQVDDWSNVALPADDGRSLGIEDDEPEVFSTRLAGTPAEDGDDLASRRPGRSRRADKVSLATATERRGRLLPEPEPGHDAADLTRRLLEGVGKS